MSLFSNLKEKTKNVEAVKDSLGGGGFGAKESDIYTGTVKVAYVGKADSGADWMQLIIENLKGSDGNDAGEFRAQVYFTSGNAKGNKPTYEKNGKEYFLPGYTVINDMMLMATGCELPDADFEEKIVKVYDFDLKAETNKSVMVPVDLVGQTVTFALEKVLEAKQVKGDNGYVDSGETREVNEIQKVFHPELLVTVVEAQEAEKAEKELTPELAVFYGAWLEKNKGKTRDKTKGSAGGNGKGGLPPKPGAGAGTGTTPAGGKSLFGKR
ncbi:ssDNA-binding protein [Escherichia phage vB_EcoP_G7C]|uniref:SsDNA-binding protein n=1 Tax=Escherichia phage vB_EcoP_G7C TaxID=1054461 RepID=G0XNU5_9CAUD|nr:single strand DNA binding protein [Escherichia phage vB_EcoP_G7C]AEL79656.1 ssDNA-binding protein [Escherichia phage vB_EcoP_G7C]